jgi:hypothetical protein
VDPYKGGIMTKSISEAKAELEKRFEKEHDWYESIVNQQAKLAFHRYVKPFCRRRKWRFMTGMGVWGFYPSADRALGRNDVILNDPEWDEIQELLSTEVPGFPDNDLGTFMPDLKDYSYDDERDQLVADAAEGDPGEEHEDECLRACPACEGTGQLMGALGNKIYFRCRNCGIEFSEDA